MVRLLKKRKSQAQKKSELSPQNAASVPQKKKIKKIHLPKEEVNTKMKKIQDQISQIQGPENHKKRKRLYYKLAKLKRALENPKNFLVDPNEEKSKSQKDLERRINKKKSKKAAILMTNQSMGKNNKSCLICKKRGHTMNECPEGNTLQKEGVDYNVKICYNCGRTDHNLKDCKKKRKKTLPFAICYVCKESGHIARDCPQNEKGMYAKGGGCYICDSVRHKASECPNNPANNLKTRKKDENKTNNCKEEKNEELAMEKNQEIEEMEPIFEEVDE